MYLAQPVPFKPSLAPVPMPPAGTPAYAKLVENVLEGLVVLIRGDEGLNIPPAAKARLKAIATVAINRANTGVWPALTSSDLRTIYNLTAKQLPWWTRLFAARL
jgi:hypothetical protein